MASTIKNHIESHVDLVVPSRTKMPGTLVGYDDLPAVTTRKIVFYGTWKCQEKIIIMGIKNRM